MAWKAGESGNPGGRPRKTQAQVEFETLCRDWSAENGFRKLTDLVESSNPRISMWALGEILDRAFGKPVATSIFEAEVVTQQGVSLEDLIQNINVLLPSAVSAAEGLCQK